MTNDETKAPKQGGAGAFVEFFTKGRGRWFLAVGIVVVVAVAVAVYLATLRNAMAGLLVAGAAFAVGGLLGFLFGIPRSLQRDSVASTDDRFQAVRANTNLEQISDWLTKIIVGVGLVQAGKIVVMVEDLAKKIAPLFLTSDSTSTKAASLVLVLMILFSIVGFLAGYLWARINLQKTFNDLEWMAQRQPEYFEGMMNSYLYMPAPMGFQKALELRDEYVKRIGPNLTDRMWTYTVCALGQQYAYKIDWDGKKEDELQESRAELLRTLKKALREDPAEAPTLLRMELYPNDSRDPELFEGDLRKFTNDEEVKKLLPKGPPRQPA